MQGKELVNWFLVSFVRMTMAMKAMVVVLVSLPCPNLTMMMTKHIRIE